MRLLPVVAAATACAALLTQPLAAQDGRQFKDAWFWGIKGGAQLYNSASAQGAVAPSIGADWVITRSRGGLYVSYDQTFFTTTGTFADRLGTTRFNHVVDLTNLRRYTMAGMIFPAQTPTLHPYLGAGVLLNQVATATMQGGPTSTSTPGAAQDSVQNKRATFSPMFIGGVQARLTRFSAFGQVIASPGQSDFFLASPSGRTYTFSLEGGIRFNVGSSIDRTR